MSFSLRRSSPAPVDRSVVTNVEPVLTWVGGTVRYVLGVQGQNKALAHLAELGIPDAELGRDFFDRMRLLYAVDIATWAVSQGAQMTTEGVTLPDERVAAWVYLLGPEQLEKEVKPYIAENALPYLAQLREAEQHQAVVE